MITKLLEQEGFIDTIRPVNNTGAGVISHGSFVCP